MRISLTYVPALWPSGYAAVPAEKEQNQNNIESESMLASSTFEIDIQTKNGPSSLSKNTMTLSHLRSPVDILGSLSFNLQNLSLFIVKSSNLTLNRKGFFTTTLHFTTELSQSLALFDSSLDDERQNEDYVQKSTIIIMQLVYTLFLTSINLDAWDTSIAILEQIDQYLKNAKSKNPKIDSWEKIELSLIEENKEQLLKVLEDYPEF